MVARSENQKTDPPLSGPEGDPNAAALTRPLRRLATIGYRPSILILIIWRVDPMIRSMFLLFLITPFTAVFTAKVLYTYVGLTSWTLLITTVVLQTALNVVIAHSSGVRRGWDVGVGLLVSAALFGVFALWAVSAGPNLG